MESQIDAVRIYNSLGEEFPLELSDTDPKQIHLEKLKPGIYFIEVLTGNLKSSQRFVKI